MLGCDGVRVGEVSRVEKTDVERIKAVEEIVYGTSVLASCSTQVDKRKNERIEYMRNI